MPSSAKLVIAVIMVTLVGCGGISKVPLIGSTPVTSIDTGFLDVSPNQFATEFPTALPLDRVQPWETLGSDGKVISATSAATEFFAGTQTDSVSGDTSAWNGALRMASGDSGAGNLSYAIYRIPLGGSEPGVVSVDANLRPMADGNLGGYYVGLADYGNGSWQWFGPVADAHWRISAVNSAREAASFTSNLGNVFVCVVAHDGAAFDVVGVGVDPVDPADSTVPDAPPAPTLTPVPGGLLVDWTAFAGGDIAGYKVYYKDSAYTELTAFSANTLGTLHDSLLRLSLEEYTPRMWWVAISTVDLSGNESVISPVVSATALPAEPELPPVWIELDNATALINQPIAMTAIGADNYDWDLDGDGVFDILGDATGTQNIDTGQAGIIRPLVRGNSSGGSFVALGAVSVIVTSNSRPVVQGFVDPAFGAAPLTVQFTSNQVDIDGDVVEYIWDFTSDGGVNFRFSSAGGATDPAPYTFTTPGLYNAKVRAWDDDGAWDVDTVTVLVITGPDPNDPIAELIATPPDCNKGETVRYSAGGSTDGNGTIVDYEWDLDEDGTFNEAGDEADHQGSSAVQQTYPEPGNYIVTVRVTDNDSATATASIKATVHGWVAPQTLDSTGTVGESTSLCVVDGNPAISYYDGTNNDLKYVRATSANGAAWGTPVAVDTVGNVGYYTSLAVVDGNPAISYWDGVNGYLKYARATDAQGGSWGTPLEVDTGAGVGSHTSLALVDGYPAISYFDETNFDVKYVRATDAQGSSWETPVAVDTAGDVGRFTSLAVVDGYPAISYWDNTNDDLKYARATDAQGSGWGSPVAVDTGGNPGWYTSMVVVDGYPAISYWDNTNGDLKYVRAADASGSSWGSPYILDSTGNVGSYTSLAVVDGNPAISYFDGTSLNLKYVRAADAQGGSWGTTIAVDTTGAVGQHTSLAVVDGNPAISYYDNTNRDLKFVRLY